MKKIVLFLICCSVQISLFAQTIPAMSFEIPDGEVFFYGVDFSEVKIVGAKETDDKFKTAFARINQLIVTELNKFDFKNLVGVPVSNYTIPAQQKTETMSWQGIRTSNLLPQKNSIENMVTSYDLPHEQGKGIVLIAWVLNKNKNMATYELVVFDIRTREILFNEEVEAEAGGFGLRNFWANSVFNVIRNRKLKKELSPVF